MPGIWRAEQAHLSNHTAVAAATSRTALLQALFEHSLLWIRLLWRLDKEHTGQFLKLLPFFQPFFAKQFYATTWWMRHVTDCKAWPRWTFSRPLTPRARARGSTSSCPLHGENPHPWLGSGEPRQVLTSDARHLKCSYLGAEQCVAID